VSNSAVSFYRSHTRFGVALALWTLGLSGGIAGDQPIVQAGPVAIKRELVFTEDFSADGLRQVWQVAIPAFEVKAGVLVGIQARDKSMTAAGDRPEIRAHPAVILLDVPTRDSVVEAKIRFEGASMIDVQFEDRTCAEARNGHISRVQIYLDRVVIFDDRDGWMNNRILAMSQDPTKRDERSRLLAARRAVYPVKLVEARWYCLAVETAVDSMRITIDGLPVAQFRSSGIAHTTKARIGFSVAGKTGLLDDIRVWRAEPLAGPGT